MRTITSLEAALIQLDSLGCSMKVMELDSRNDAYNLRLPNGRVQEFLSDREVINIANKLMEDHLVMV